MSSESVGSSGAIYRLMLFQLRTSCGEREPSQQGSKQSRVSEMEPGGVSQKALSPSDFFLPSPNSIFNFISLRITLQDTHELPNSLSLSF